IFAGSGAYGDSQLIAIGAAISANTIAVGVQALATGSNIEAPTIQVHASSDSNIEGIALAGAGAEGMTFGGSLSNNLIRSAIEARVVDGATLHAGTPLEIHAHDDAGI